MRPASPCNLAPTAPLGLLIISNSSSGVSCCAPVEASFGFLPIEISTLTLLGVGEIHWVAISKLLSKALIELATPTPPRSIEAMKSFLSKGSAPLPAKAP